MSASEAKRLIIKNGTLIDGSGKAPAANGASAPEVGRRTASATSEQQLVFDRC